MAAVFITSQSFSRSQSLFVASSPSPSTSPLTRPGAAAASMTSQFFSRSQSQSLFIASTSRLTRPAPLSIICGTGDEKTPRGKGFMPLFGKKKNVETQKKGLDTKEEDLEKIIKQIDQDLVEFIRNVRQIGTQEEDLEEELDGNEEMKEEDLIKEVEKKVETQEDDLPDYTERLREYQNRTKLVEAVQTGLAKIRGIPVAIGVMDSQFVAGSMGSVVGEKLTRLIELATIKSLPLIIVCASGGARMQEGSLSLMQMAKISSALHFYRQKNCVFIAVLTSPTTGGVTASFAMLGDIIIAEPKAYIAFAGKRVIEETLKLEVPAGSQEAEVLLEAGLLDQIIPREDLENILYVILKLHRQEKENSTNNQADQVHK